MDGDTIEKAKMEANMLVKSAIEEISILPDTPAKKNLIALAKSVVERNY
jgi:geranylgeranyl pyrophosphate synthase